MDVAALPELVYVLVMIVVKVLVAEDPEVPKVLPVPVLVLVMVDVAVPLEPVYVLVKVVVKVLVGEDTKDPIVLILVLVNVEVATLPEFVYVLVIIVVYVVGEVTIVLVLVLEMDGSTPDPELEPSIVLVLVLVRVDVKVLPERVVEEKVPADVEAKPEPSDMTDVVVMVSELGLLLVNVVVKVGVNVAVLKLVPVLGKVELYVVKLAGVLIPVSVDADSGIELVYVDVYVVRVELGPISENVDEYILLSPDMELVIVDE
ncbi:hypothetical protein K445DRAFT_24262 [Daldinia sp. EC12]|nr:hypothetical protein K445DRAFT_24262 [Daldinia sp. EC12]